MDANSIHKTGDSDSPVPVETSPPHTTPEAAPSSAGVIVLQWLTYAFWGWLILGLLWLMSVILINAILGESVNEAVPYAIAATIVLLPLAFFCDLFYRKHEPAKKVGAATVIMVVHAVLFALLGIGSLIVAAFTGINALINIGEPINNQMVVLLVALFATLLYVGAFVRTLSPFKSKKPTLVYGLIMASLTVILLIFAIVGPVVTSLASRGDRLIEQALPSVQTSVDNYITKNKKLPSSLSDVTFSNADATNLVKDGKVEYKPLDKATAVTLNDLTNKSTTYRYQLCVDYKAEKNSGYSYSGSASDNSDGYSTYISTYSHGAGNTCYKMQQTVY